MTRGTLNLTETDEFTFDAEAADRVVRFIERYCYHFEGRHAGKPFILHPSQKKIVRDVFGWKWRHGRKAGLRRFTDVYFESAVGAGKSPLLAAIGLYGLIGDHERGAEVYSLASTFSQARIVFDTAKRFARGSPELSRRLDVVEREIRHPATGSTWKIVSGKGPGAGAKPSMILGDEVHEWTGPGGYQDLRDRMFKRTQPLLITATNAGKTRASFCWLLREKAAAALAGTGDPTLYPIIWAADEEDATDDPEAWRKANPLLGITVFEGDIAKNAREAAKDPVEESNFRRVTLGIWPKQGAGRWLDLSFWDAAETREAPPADAPVYPGLDLSLVDDLCAAAYVYPTPGILWISAHFWMPEATARKYEEKDGIPFHDWADAGHIELVKEPTISADVQKRIAAAVLARGKSKIKAVCYDRARVSTAIAELEGAGVACVPVPQGYTLSPGCAELERRLKEGSVRIVANPVLRWNAENTEVKTDDRGNFWPAKPNAKGRYAGTSKSKIDGITALVTALTEARKHEFPAARKAWQGSISVVRSTDAQTPAKKEPATCWT